MIRVKGAEEYEISCENCKEVIIFDSPEDVKKEDRQNSIYRPMYCVICPICGEEIWFDGILQHPLSPDFAKQVKPKSKETLDKKSEDLEIAEAVKNLNNYLNDDLDD